MNSPNTNQINSRYVNIFSITLSLVPDNVLTQIKQNWGKVIRAPLTCAHFLPRRSDYVTGVTSGVTALLASTHVMQQEPISGVRRYGTYLFIFIYLFYLMLYGEKNTKGLLVTCTSSLSTISTILSIIIVFD